MSERKVKGIIVSKKIKISVLEPIEQKHCEIFAPSLIRRYNLKGL